ncbi:hypothetical protein EMIT036CA2_50103 [Chryseobacterium sp. IT-36CA2]
MNNANEKKKRGIDNFCHLLRLLTVSVENKIPISINFYA